MLFIWYPKCSTCVNAKKILDDKNFQYIVRDINIETPSYEELKEYYDKSKLNLKKFFNTSGLVYKNLNLKEKIDSLTDEEKLKLLASNGMLIKRPLLITDDSVIIGFKKDIYDNL